MPSGGVSRAPDSHGGDQTSQQHQEPWCQSALPGQSAHVPARVAAARAYERLPACHEAAVYWAMITVMTRRLARPR